MINELTNGSWAKLLSAAIADGLLHGQFPKHWRDHLLSQHLHNVLELVTAGETSSNLWIWPIVNSEKWENHLNSLDWNCNNLYYIIIILLYCSHMGLTFSKHSSQRTTLIRGGHACTELCGPMAFALALQYTWSSRTVLRTDVLQCIRCTSDTPPTKFCHYVQSLHAHGQLELSFPRLELNK